MKPNFFVCSAGEPNKGYDEENFLRCQKFNAHLMHRNTKQKGAFDLVKSQDIIILKYQNHFVAYGQVIKKSTEKNPSLGDWNYAIYVDKWHWHNDGNHYVGIPISKVAANVISGNNYSTIKEINETFALTKLKEINAHTPLLYNLTIMDEYKDLLLEGYNLILTGAPGTGKTHLAIEIAKNLTTDVASVPVSNRTKLCDLVENFTPDLQHRNELQETRAKFIADYPKENLSKLTLSSYCIGSGSNDSFCWWLERGLKALGYYFPGSSLSYFIYYSKEQKDYSIHGYWKKQKEARPELTNEQLMEMLAHDIADMVEKKQYDERFGQAFYLKLLNTYYPDEFFPVNSEEHLNRIISIFELDSTIEDFEEKNKEIQRFYKEMTNGRDITSFEFAEILYNNFAINPKKSNLLPSSKQSEYQGEYQLVQFHPSYDYTDFVEGLRPYKNPENDTIGFELRKGIFKQFCEKALQNQIDCQKSQEERTEEDSFEKKYFALLAKIQNEEITQIPLKSKTVQMDIVSVSDGNNIKLKTEKSTSDETYTVSLERLKKLAKTFTNLEEVEAIKNIFKEITEVIGGCHSSAYWAVLHYIYENFDTETELSAKVLPKKYVFIIDEINRGEMSKILGELFFSVDPGYRGVRGAVKTQYANLCDSPSIFDDYLHGLTDDNRYDGNGWFFIPDNVYLIGTMNDIDRSVESMDFAMRRRFTWKEIKAADHTGMLDRFGKEKAALVERMNRLNEAISQTEGLNDAYHIGGAYYANISRYMENGHITDKSYQKLWQLHLKGILYEYLRGMPDADELLKKLESVYHAGTTV